MRVAKGLLSIAQVFADATTVLRAFALIVSFSVSFVSSGCKDRDREPTVDGSAGRLVSVEPTPARGRVGEPVQLLVTVYDLDGVPRSGERVSIESSQSEDVFSARDGVTDDAGELVTTLTASVEGRRVVTAHVGSAKGVVTLAIDRSSETEVCTGDVLLGGYPPVESLPDDATTSLMATGDFDGDGSCETALVSDDRSVDRSTRLTTRGATDWPEVRDLMGPGWFPISVATGDFDGDGRTDLAVVGTVTGWLEFRVEWYSADDDRVWQRIAALDLPGAGGLVPADIDGDGTTDLLVAGSELRTVFLREDGPVFGEVESLQTGGKRLLGWVAGDFDGDGRADIAVATHGEITIHEGSGDGTFTPRQTLDVWGDQLVAADLDGDGVDDLAIFETDSEESFLTIFRGRADGTFERLRIAYAGNGRLTTGDVDGDGVADLVLRPGSWDGTEVLVVRGDPEGHFTGPERLLGLPIPPRDLSFCSGGSGRPEVVVLGADAWVRIPMEVPAREIVSTTLEGGGGLIGDPTGDGSVEIVTVDDEGHGRRIEIGAAGETHTVQEFEVHRQVPGAAFRVGRVGDESIGSIVEFGFQDPGHAIFVHSLSTDTFRLVDAPIDWVLALAVVDVDGDGLGDIVYGTNTGTFALFADRAGGFRRERVTATGAWAIAAGDVDGDGAIELILAGWPDVLAVPFDSSFGPPELLPMTPAGIDQPLFTGDFDGDGKDDVALGGNGETLSVYLHAADGRFGPALEFGVGGPIRAGAYGRLAGGADRGFVFLADGPAARVVPVTCTEP